jgi:FAD/FMN-containing dehydrogenase
VSIYRLRIRQFFSKMASHSVIANFKGDIVKPGDLSYDSAIARWAGNASRKASLVAFVRDEADVALAIKHAKDNSLSIAIRGGGHSPSGASSVEGGLVIDLSRYMNGVHVDAEKRIATVGGGALWRNVDETAIKHGLATVGGTVNHVSVYLCLGVISLTKHSRLELADLL